MNYPATIANRISDVQGEWDTRNIAINKVGIKDICHPIVITDRTNRKQHTIARFNMYVGLTHDIKGAHMSRFVELLNGHEHEITIESFKLMLKSMTEMLDTNSGHIEMSFPYFVEKAAPVTGAQGLLDYHISFIGQTHIDSEPQIQIKVIVPITTLCPCAKKISDYGAHNQRSHVTLNVTLRTSIWIEELINVVESAASCELYSLLKRADEKYVTEYAYNNPKFVEDIVRDIAVKLNNDARISGYTIESENFESIHNHSAYAKVIKGFHAQNSGVLQL